MRAFLLLGAILCVAGCSTVTERMNQRFSTAAPQERVFQHEEERVFAAARAALHELGYEITRSGAAQGLIDAESRRLPTEQFGASQQFVLEVRLRSVDPGVTTVTALLRQVTEGDFAAGASGQPLREHGRYDIFFDLLEKKLATGS